MSENRINIVMNQKSSIMNRPSSGRVSYWRTAVLAAIVYWCVLVGGDAFGQNKGKKIEEEPATRNWSMGWAVTLLAMGLVIAPVCMAAKRQWDLPFQLDEMEEEKQKERVKRETKSH